MTYDWSAWRDPCRPGCPCGCDEPEDDDTHAPWHYTEYGVICACGEAMDTDERCTSLDRQEPK